VPGKLASLVFSDAGVSVKWAATSAVAVVCRAKGCAPERSSYAITPHAYRSARWSVLESPTACSGDMYAGVPIDVPIDVSVPPGACVVDAESAFAIPKSATTAVPDDNRMFSGLMSR
jgi:hypothetical protein